MEGRKKEKEKEGVRKEGKEGKGRRKELSKGFDHHSQFMLTRIVMISPTAKLTRI